MGFIQNLPHQLVDAFSATLEEVTESDLLIQVIDAASPHCEAQIQSVYNVLEDLKALSMPIINVFNKIDLLEKPLDKKILKKYHPSIALSAQNNEGLEDLKLLIAKNL